MGFHEIKDSDGKVIGTAIVCTRGHAARCQDCGAPSSILCDFPVTRNGKQGTCDRKCCRKHSEPMGIETDYCLPHYRHDLAQKAGRP